MGKTMKQDEKVKATFAKAVSRTLDLIARNAHSDGLTPTIIEIKVMGKTEGVLRLEVENLNEVIKMLQLNDK